MKLILKKRLWSLKFCGILNKMCNILENYCWTCSYDFFKGAIFGVLRLNISKSMLSVFWLAIFGSSTYRRKTYDIFETVMKFRVRNLLLCKNIDSKIWPYLTWPWRDLHQKKVNLGDVIGSDDHHYRYLV